MRLLSSVMLLSLGIAAAAATLAHGPAALAQSGTAARSSGAAAATSTTSATAGIADFAGPWIGRTEPGSDRERAATVLIEPAANRAFRLTWASFEADPSGSGNVVKRERSLSFKPSKEAAIWLSEVGTDPFETLFAWAYIDGRTLVVSTAGLRPDGKLERQSYRRTLTADGLDLSYKRWLDQDLDREIEAEFLRLTPEPARMSK